jgi:hypothetical protein
MSLGKNPLPRRRSPSLRLRVARAFQLTARGVDQATAFARSQAFYRSGGGAWARSLG